MNKQTPRIVYSPLSMSWFVATRYKEREAIDAETGKKTNYIVSTIKYDVTDQMTAILKRLKRKTRP